VYWIKESMKNNSPFLLKPAVKQCLWGGTKIYETFAKTDSTNLISASVNMEKNTEKNYSLIGKNVEDSKIGETWECSTNEAGISLVASGVYDGMHLTEVLREHPEFMGKWQNPNGELPILVKLIDAKKDLSVQVHPGDSYAKTHENGAMGKTEMWYILDAKTDSELIYGLEHDTTREQLKKSLLDGTANKYLKKVPVKKGDSFFIKAGTVHGIGKGILLAEIQENSNITYRLYDYNRSDSNGKKRTLHIEKGLEVANLYREPEPKQKLRQIHYKKGYALENICNCSYFQVERILLNTEMCRMMMELPDSKDSFQVLLCTGGCGVLLNENEILTFFKGDCIFVPANSKKIKLHGAAEMLRVLCA